MADKEASPCWGYHPEEGAKLFEDGEMPKGWYDSPANFPKAKSKPKAE